MRNAIRTAATMPPQKIPTQSCSDVSYWSSKMRRRKTGVLTHRRIGHLAAFTHARLIVDEFHRASAKCKRSRDPTARDGSDSC